MAASNAIDTLIESVKNLDYGKDHEAIKQKVTETLNQCEVLANEEGDNRDLWANYDMVRAYTELSKIFPEFKEHSNQAINDLEQTIF